MCTFLLYFDPDSNQPFTMASTRDEALTRQTSLPSKSDWSDPKSYGEPLHKDSGRLHLNFLSEPAKLPPEQQRVLDSHDEVQKQKITKILKTRDTNRYKNYTNAGIQAPKDLETGATFAGINKHGLVVAVNNLEASFQFTHKLSRGGLVLDALTFESAEEAAEALYKKVCEIQQAGIKGAGNDSRNYYKYPAFNLIIADHENAYVLQSAPYVANPDDRSHLTVRGGEKRMTRLKNGGDMAVIGCVGGQAISVSLEPVKPRTPTMICGWWQNDGRSLRTKELLPSFDKLVHEHKLPDGKNLASWAHWLDFMQDRTQGKGAAYTKSIAQPPFDVVVDNDMSGRRVTWGTISTSLYAINKVMPDKSRGEEATEYKARMYFSPTAPTLERPMHFQRVKVTTRSGGAYYHNNTETYPIKNEIFIPEHDGHRATWFATESDPSRERPLTFTEAIEAKRKTILGTQPPGVRPGSSGIFPVGGE